MNNYQVTLRVPELNFESTGIVQAEDEWKARTRYMAFGDTPRLSGQFVEYDVKETDKDITVFQKWTFEPYHTATNEKLVIQEVVGGYTVYDESENDLGFFIDFDKAVETVKSGKF